MYRGNSDSFHAGMRKMGGMCRNRSVVYPWCVETSRHSVMRVFSPVSLCNNFHIWKFFLFDSQDSQADSGEHLCCITVFSLGLPRQWPLWATVVWIGQWCCQRWVTVLPAAMQLWLPLTLLRSAHSAQSSQQWPACYKTDLAIDHRWSL